MSKPITAEALIEEGATLRNTIETSGKRLKEIEETLLSSLPSGKHDGANGTGCTIVAPSPSIKLGREDVDAVRELAGDEAFRKLFDRVVSYKPVKAFREVLAAVVVKKRPANGILKLTEKSSNPYVKW